jgi:hypothetical protein
VGRGAAERPGDQSGAASWRERFVFEVSSHCFREPQRRSQRETCSRWSPIPSPPSSPAPGPGLEAGGWGSFVRARAWRPARAVVTRSAAAPGASVLKTRGRRDSTRKALSARADGHLALPVAGGEGTGLEHAPEAGGDGLAPALESDGRWAQTELASVSARSVRSQEKPPSGSDARPKWPYAAVRA